MPEITVTHSPDCMKAYLYVSDCLGGAVYPTEAQLSRCLGEHGVVYGIDNTALHSMFEAKVCNTHVDVAHGLAPSIGVAGKIEILVDVSSKGKPRKLADGRVDHRDISFVVNISKGTPLIRRIAPTPGVPGTTVFNKIIPASPMTDVTLTPGRGAVISPDDPNVLIADITGALTLHADGKIEIVDNKVVTGNIDYSTGNIRFSGNLRVTGTVRSGFQIEVEGDCRIGGNIEDALITSRGDVEILGGAIGASKGAIKCGGSLKIRHIANFTVESGEDICISEDALHCTLSTQGGIKAKSLVGGSIAAWKTVEVDTIGTEAEPKTIMDLGGRFLLLQKKYHLLKELTALTGEIGSLKETMFTLTRDQMDCGGILSAAAIDTLEGLKKNHVQRREKCSAVQNDIEVLDNILNTSPVPSVKAQTIFPNTIIKFGSAEKLIKEKLNHALITVDGEKIVIGKY